MRDLKAELTGEPRTFTLKEDAVPSVFAFSEQKKKRKSSETRAAKRARKELICSLESQPSSPAEHQPSPPAEHQPSFVEPHTSPAELQLPPPDIDDQVPCSSQASYDTEESTDDECLTEQELDVSYVVEEDEENENNRPDFNMMFVTRDQIKPMFGRCVQCGSQANVFKWGNRICFDPMYCRA